MTKQRHKGADRNVPEGRKPPAAAAAAAAALRVQETGGGRGDGVRLWLKILTLAACAVYGLSALRNLYGYALILPFPADVNAGEGVLIYEAQRLAQGLPIYKPLNEPPYWFSTYPPLYQATVSLFGGLLWARAVSLAASLWSCAALGLMVWSMTGPRGERGAPGGSDAESRAGKSAGAREAQSSSSAGGLWRLGPALLASLLWLTSPFADNWAPLARVDLLGRGLESAAVFLVWRCGARPWGFWASLGFALLAMLTKQTCIAGGLTCAAYLWFSSRRRSSLLYLAGWIGATALAYALLTLATGGYFWRNVFADTSRQFQPELLWGWLSGFAETHAAMLVAAALGLWALRPFAQGRIFALAALAGVPGMLLAANDGADVNYFFDFLWGLCGLAGLGAAAVAQTQLAPRGARSEARRLPGGLRQLVSVGVLLAFGLLLLVWAPMRIPSAEQRRMSREMIAGLAAAPKPVLAEYVGYALAAGSKPDYLPYMYRKLEEQGRWDSRPLTEKIRAREYGAILISSSASLRWSPQILEAIFEAYEPKQEFSNAYIVEGEISQLLLTPAEKR